MADDGVTVLDTLWAGPATGSAFPGSTTTMHARGYNETNLAETIYSTPRTGGDISPNALSHNPYTSLGSSQSTKTATSLLTGTYESQSHVPGSPSGLTQEPTGYGYDTKRGDSSKYQQRPFLHGSRGDDWAENEAIVASNYTTKPYELSPQHTARRNPVASLPVDVQSSIHSLERRYIQTNPNENSNHERLDSRK